MLVPLLLIAASGGMLVIRAGSRWRLDRPIYRWELWQYWPFYPGLVREAYRVQP